MVFPLYDDNQDRTTTPFVNYAIIALNILVFVFLQGLGSSTDFTYAFSTVPQEIMTGRDVVTDARVVEYAGQRVLIPGLGATPLSVYLTLFTSMFMHGGIAHIAGNMLFLWIFGDNIEDRLGHVRYVIFYLLCGLIASLAHVFTTAAFAGEQADMLVPSRRFGSDFRSVGWLHPASSFAACDRDSFPLPHRRSRLGSDRDVVRVPVDKRAWRAW